MDTIATTVLPQDWFLLEWLSVEETSAYGECRGKNLSRLIEGGFAHFAAHAGDPDYSRVALTEAGWQALKEGRKEREAQANAPG